MREGTRVSRTLKMEFGSRENVSGDPTRGAHGRQRGTSERWGFPHTSGCRQSLKTPGPRLRALSILHHLLYAAILSEPPLQMGELGRRGTKPRALGHMATKGQNLDLKLDPPDPIDPGLSQPGGTTAVVTRI